MTSPLPFNYGGGVYSSGTATFTNNTISDNTANEHGGGIYVYSGETTLINNVISGNITNDGGGVYIYRPDTTTLTNNTITSNRAGDNGGGIWLELWDTILGTPDTASLTILDDDGITEYSTLKIEALTGGGKLILKAKANKGFKFTGWGGDCQSKKKKITVPMDTDRDCSVDLVPKNAMNQSEAQAEAELSTLTITAPTGSGKLILKAKANKGFKFKGWKGDCSGKKKTTVPMDSDRVCTAKFVQK